MLQMNPGLGCSFTSETSVSVPLCQGSPALIFWEIMVGITGLGTSTLSSCTTWCLLASPLPPWSRQSPGQCRESSSGHLVSLHSFLFHESKQEYSCAYIHLSRSAEIHCTLGSCVISSPTFGPVSLWAGLSSSDRKNTILSGKCKGTRGESGPLGDLQAHRPRPLAAHTPSTPPPNTNKPSEHGHAKHTHARNPLPHSTDSISAPWQLSCTFPLPPNSLLFCD